MNEREFRAPPFWWLFLAALVINFLSQAIHEGGHWAVYQAAGLRPVWGYTALVQLWEGSPLHPEAWIQTVSPTGETGWLRLSGAPGRTEEIIIDAAGPAASLLAAVIGLLVSHFDHKPSRRNLGLMFTLVGSFIMVTYYARSGMRTGGDEGFLAALLGFPKAWLDISLGLAFFTCLVLALVQLRSWKRIMVWMGAMLLGIVPGGALMYILDPVIRSGIDQGNPFFRPIAGVSLPVLVSDFLALTGLFLLGRMTRVPSTPVPER